jgi:TP901 family phage tail tape measure protein
MAPLTLGLGKGTQVAARFEQGMADVSAVSKGLSEKDFAALSAEAKRVGATTSKSAFQATQGLVFLKRAGFDTAESLTSLQAVVNAAEADNIDLGTAANIGANAVRAMGLEASQMTRVMDVLALTSARTNTDMIGLGEAMKFVAPTAAQLNVSIEDTALSLGLLANAGLKGTVGGTALNNMLLKLSTASDATKEAFKKLGITVEDSSGNMVNIKDIMRDLANAHLKQAAFLSETFGLRGQRAAGNLATAFERMRQPLADGTNAFDNLVGQIQNASGAAKEMAELRLKSLTGSMTILKSAAEGLTIEAFGPMLPAMQNFAKGASTAVGQVVKGISLLRSSAEGSNEEFQKLPPTAQAVSRGINEAIDTIVSALATLRAAFGRVKEGLLKALGPTGLQTLVKVGIIFGVVAGAVAPILLAFAGLALVAAKLWPTIKAIGTAMRAIGTVLSGPVGAAIAVAIGLFVIFKKEIMDFVGGFIEGLLPALAPLEEVWTRIVGAMKSVWDELSNTLRAGLAALGIDWGGLGNTAGSTLGTIISFIGEVIATVVEWGAKILVTAIQIGAWITENVVSVFQAVWDKISFAINIAKMLGQVVAGIAAKIWEWIKSKVVAILETVKEKLSGVIDFFKRMSDTASEVLSAIGGFFDTWLITPLKDALSWLNNLIGGWEGLRAIVGSVLSWIKGQMETSLLGPIRAVVRAIIELAEAMDVDVPAGLRKFASPGPQGFGAAVRGRAAALRGAAAPAFQPAFSGVTFARSKAQVEAAKAAGTEAGKAMNRGLGGLAKSLSDRDCETKTTVNIDGKTAARAQAKVSRELSERAGFGATPWMRRMFAEQGATTLPA